MFDFPKIKKYNEHDAGGKLEVLVKFQETFPILIFLMMKL